MQPGDFFDYEPLEHARLRVVSVVDGLLIAGSVIILVAWLAGHPLFYSPGAPVLSPFTALSLLLMVGTRQARLHIETWPMALSLAMSGLVLGGNASSIVMLTTTSPQLGRPSPTSC